MALDLMESHGTFHHSQNSFKRSKEKGYVVSHQRLLSELTFHSNERILEVNQASPERALLT